MHIRIALLLSWLLTSLSNAQTGLTRPTGIPIALEEARQHPNIAYDQEQDLPTMPKADKTGQAGGEEMGIVRYRASSMVRIRGMEQGITWRGHPVGMDTAGITLIPPAPGRFVTADGMAATQWTVPWSDVRKITAWKRGARGRSGLKGGAIGLAGGFLLGVTLLRQDGNFFYTSMESAVIMGVLAMPVGAAIGLGTGGKRDRMKVNGDPMKGARAAGRFNRWCIRRAPDR